MIDHEPHISDLRWDRLLAGDLPDDTRETVHDHAAQCAACATRLRELTSERDAFGLSPTVELARVAPGLAPAYRDDVDAARARCASLEAELRGTRTQLARLDHVTRALEAARARGPGAPEYAELEDRVVALQRELRDLELLGRGDAAMTDELAAIERKATSRRGQGELELYVAGSRARALAGPVWAPRRRLSRTVRAVVATVAAALGLVPVVWGAAIAVETSKTIIPPWGESAVDIALWLFTLIVAGWFGALWFVSLFAGVRGARDEAKVVTALVGPDELCGRPWSTAQAIRFAPSELVVSFDDRELMFDTGNPYFQTVVAYARAAAIAHGLEVDGELPSLPEVADG